MADAYKQASFIPQKPLDQEGPVRKPVRTRSLFALIAGIVFVASLAAAVGAFLYEKYQEAALASKKQELATAREAFDPELIGELKRLDTRMEVAQALIGGHVRLTPIFEHIENTTLKGIRLTALEIKESEDGEGYELTLSGTTDSYTTLALQSESYSEARILYNTVFSNFALDEVGNVLFDMTAKISASAIGEENVISSSL